MESYDHIYGGSESMNCTWNMSSHTPFTNDVPPPGDPSTCLKLGKRPYHPANVGDTVKKATAHSAAVVACCQVEGCNVALAEAKDYHRRHKVCVAHSKAPVAVVCGLQQRFCQQCSRFHVISEFDESKRSCRRRLAGHNERRRKSSSSDAFIRNASLDCSAFRDTRIQYEPASIFPGCALSLLSSEDPPWIPSNFSQQSSTALCELIAKSRAAQLPKQSFSDHINKTQISYFDAFPQLLPSSRFAEVAGGWEVTLPLHHFLSNPSGHQES